jgi:hypothetical protein
MSVAVVVLVAQGMTDALTASPQLRPGRDHLIVRLHNSERRRNLRARPGGRAAIAFTAAVVVRHGGGHVGAGGLSRSAHAPSYSEAYRRMVGPVGRRDRAT